MFFFQLLNPKNFILSNRFLSSLDIRKRKKILTTFYSIQSLKNKKNFYFKEKVIKFFSLLDYSGGTRYTDLVILILIIEIYNSSLILTPAICVLWSLLIISKFVYFKLKIIENLK
jgi:hypothetical protein